jgi:hypothetical protein
VGVAGGAVAGAAWSLVDFTVAAAVVGAINGVFSGWRRIHCWRSPRGWAAFVLDSTWALITTAAALFAHAVAAVQRRPGNYVAELSERSDRHVYVNGFAPRRGFLTTLGNVVSGAGPEIRTSPWRQRVVTDHEDVHVWQARWWGPLYPVLYGLWTVIGGAVGAVRWIVQGRKEKLWNVIETTAYYSNPFEWWAYSRQGRWPPPGAIARLTWRRPARNRSMGKLSHR